MPSDQELIAQYIATKGVTRIERPWPDSMQTWREAMHRSAISGNKASNRVAAKRAHDAAVSRAAMASRYHACDERKRDFLIDSMAAERGCSRTRILELLRKAGIRHKADRSKFSTFSQAGNEARRFGRLQRLAAIRRKFEANPTYENIISMAAEKGCDIQKIRKALRAAGVDVPRLRKAPEKKK